MRLLRAEGGAMKPAIATVADHMRRHLVTVTGDMEIVEAVSVLMENGVSGACVLDEDGELVGVLSKRDCLKAALNASYYKQWGGTVADYMATDLETLDASLDIVDAAERFVGSAFRRFPVLSGGRLVGQISRTDVLGALSAQWR
ncbi:CBS domain-containing protein [Aureimonas altamirensis]|uniref:CBS domain-containing protein n=1 Tax=Aureimonas altamirensis TaxID=370622 RepID=UPI001E3491A6|nr:CBS domain-containing protein [Aureimonas altamirensis]UHD46466.1 CBS domain-containing protein [Aureimonas altamirensis]